MSERRLARCKVCGTTMSLSEPYGTVMHRRPEVDNRDRDGHHIGIYNVGDVWCDGEFEKVQTLGDLMEGSVDYAGNQLTWVSRNIPVEELSVYLERMMRHPEGSAMRDAYYQLLIMWEPTLAGFSNKRYEIRELWRALKRLVDEADRP